MIIQVVGVIFDKAVEEPKFCSLYAELCKVQVDHELRVNIKVSDMRTAILNRAQETFINRAKQENDDKVGFLEMYLCFNVSTIVFTSLHCLFIPVESN